jgi:hypothetical protein
MLFMIAGISIKSSGRLTLTVDENETRSISVWEKANPKAMHDCEKQSGWK